MADAGQESPPNSRAERRGGDRREAQLPIEGPERRRASRRSGRDRRLESRPPLTP